MAENSGGSLGNETVRIGLIWENEVATLNKVVAEAQALVKDGMKDGVQIKIDESAFAKDVQKMLGTMSKQLSKVKLTGMDAGSLKSFSTMTAGLANLSRRFDTNGISKATTTFEKLAQAASLAAADAQKAASTVKNATNQIGSSSQPIKLDIDLSDLKTSLADVTKLMADVTSQVQQMASAMSDALQSAAKEGFKLESNYTAKTTRATPLNQYQADIYDTAVLNEAATAEQKRAKAEADRQNAELKRLDTEYTIARKRAKEAEQDAADARKRKADEEAREKKLADQEAAAQEKRDKEAAASALKQQKEADKAAEAQAQQLEKRRLEIEKLNAAQEKATKSLTSDENTKSKTSDYTTQLTDITQRWNDFQKKISESGNLEELSVERLRAYTKEAQGFVTELNKLQTNSKYDIGSTENVKRESSIKNLLELQKQLNAELAKPVEPDTKTPQYFNRLTQIRDEWSQLQAKMTETGSILDLPTNQLDSAVKSAQNLASAFRSLNSDAKLNIDNNKGQLFELSSVAQFEERARQVASTYGKIIDSTVKYSATANTWNATVQAQDGTLVRLKASLDGANNGLRMMSTTLSEAASLEATETKALEQRAEAIQKLQTLQNSIQTTLTTPVDSSAKTDVYFQRMIEFGERWSAIQKRLPQDGSFAGLSINTINSITSEMKSLNDEMTKLQNNTSLNANNKDGMWVNLPSGADFRAQAQQMASAYGVMVQGTEQYSVSAGKWQATVQAQNGDLIQLKATMDSTGTGYRMLETHLSESASAFKRVGITFKEIATNYIRYFSGQQLVTRVIGQVRKGWNEIKELDAAYTELRKVSDETTAALQSFRAESYGIANDAVSTGKAIQQSAADWVRLGKSIEDAAEFAKNTSIYANVGDMDIDTATEHMISTVQAFRDDFETEVIASAEIADIFNELDNNFAITAEGLGSAMERAAAALVAANNDIYQSAALVTAGNTIMQDPELMGNTLKVVSMRIRGAKAELEEMGEETEGVAESTSKLRREILALTGVDIMTDANTFKSTYDILDEISKIFDDLSDVSQANVLETLAGKLRGSAVAALLDNFDIAREALDAAINSEGSAARENAAYAESIEGHLMKIQNTWQQIWSDTATRESVNLFLDMANGASELLQQVGLLNAAFGILMGYLSSKSGVGRGEMFPLIEYADCTLVVTRNEYNPRGYIRVC